MRAVTDSLIVPQIIDFLKIATRKPTRAYMEGMVARRALPESVLGLSDAEFEAGPATATCPIRASAATSSTAIGRPSRTSTWTRSGASPGWFADAARRARDSGFDGVELHFAHAYTMASFLSVTERAHRRLRRQLREPDAPAPAR